MKMEFGLKKICSIFQKSFNKRDLMCQGFAVFIFVLFSTCALLSAVCVGDTDEKCDVVSELQLHNLSNEELLNLSQKIYNEASDNFLAQLRGLTKSDMAFKEATNVAKELRVPGEKLATPSGGMQSLEFAKISLVHSKKRLDVLKEKLKLVQSEKSVLDKHGEQLVVAQSAADALLDAIRKIDKCLLESQLRVVDGTLTPHEIPNLLELGRIEAIKAEFKREQNGLNRKHEIQEKDLKRVGLRLENAEKAVIEAEKSYSAQEVEYALELKRQTIEQEYLAMDVDKLPGIVDSMQEDMVWLNGAFNLSYSKFSNSRDNVVRVETELEGLSLPEATMGGMLHYMVSTAKAEQAVKEAEAIYNYYTGRSTKLGQLKRAQKIVVEDVKVFEGDAIVFSEHVFKTRVLLKTFDRLVKEGKISADSITATVKYDDLVTTEKMVSEAKLEAFDSNQKAEEQLKKLDGQIVELETILDEKEVWLAQVKKGAEAARNAEQWNAELKQLTSEQLIVQFRENSENLEMNKLELKSMRDDIKKADGDVSDAVEVFGTLKGAFLRAAYDEGQAEKQKIVESIYEFANIELPKIEGEESSTDKTQPEEAAGGGSANGGEQIEEVLSSVDLEAYQGLILNRIRAINVQEKCRVTLLDYLNNLKQKVGGYITSMTRATAQAQRQQANAIELKKRLGRKEIAGSDLPHGISDALKNELIAELEANTDKAMKKQAIIAQQITSVSRYDEEMFDKTVEMMNGIDGKIGNRMDIIKDNSKLEHEFKTRWSSLSDTERKTMEQKAERRVEDEDSIPEYLLGFIPSEQAENQTDILKAYHMEILEMEFKLENIGEQNKKIDRLINLVDEEKVVIQNILPLIDKEVKQLEVEKNEELTKIKLRLVPQNANEILDDFRKETGRDIAIPTPIAEEERVDAIKTSADSIFDRHIKIVAGKKWISFFEQRLSPLGAAVEVGGYEKKQNLLNTEKSSINRRIKFLSGVPQEERETLLAGELPQNEVDKRRLIDGEMGIVRMERYNIHSVSAIMTVVKLLIILLITFIVSWLVSRFANRLIKKAKEKEGANDAHSLAIYSLIRMFAKVFIWMISVIAMLDALSFQVSALLAGLGIGGLAIAMALKGTLSDIIGGLNILLSKPFKVGDYINYKGAYPEVRSISLRYTTLFHYGDNANITVPNAELAESATFCYRTGVPWRVVAYIPLSIRNSAEKVKLAKTIIENAFEAHNLAKLDKIRFAHFNDYSFTIKLRYEIPFDAAYSKCISEVNEEILRLFQENNIEVASRPSIKVE